MKTAIGPNGLNDADYCKGTVLGHEPVLMKMVRTAKLEEVL